MTKYPIQKVKMPTQKQMASITKKQTKRMQDILAWNQDLEKRGSRTRINLSSAFDDDQFKAERKRKNEAVKNNTQYKKQAVERKERLIKEKLKEQKEYRLKLKEENYSVKDLKTLAKATDDERFMMTQKQLEYELRKMDTKDIARLRTMNDSYVGEKLEKKGNEFFIERYFKGLKHINPEINKEKLDAITKFIRKNPHELDKMISYVKSDVFKGDMYMLDGIDMEDSLEYEGEMERRLNELYGYVQSTNVKGKRLQKKAMKNLPWNSRNL